MNWTIDTLRPEDWPAARATYLEGIATGLATFETHAPRWETWNAGHLPFGRLALREGETLLGWAALSPVSKRGAYRGVAEVSVYVHAAVRGQGGGRALLQSLIEASEENGIWTLQATIFARNTASLQLHRRCGFREVGRREQIAQLRGVWEDTILMERRSRVVGG